MTAHDNFSVGLGRSKSKEAKGKIFTLMATSKSSSWRSLRYIFHSGPMPGPPRQVAHRWFGELD